ncbi:hypothetical protein QT397_05080 [Microbulbifer sp. MKSA007]|nr:hypothetical protein QT397_05080 [Microbulbifer sp. MKSA007]
MGDQINSQEFHLSLKQISQASGSGTLRYLSYRDQVAKLGLEYSGVAPFPGEATDFTPPPKNRVHLKPFGVSPC